MLKEIQDYLDKIPRKSEVVFWRPMEIKIKRKRSQYDNIVHSLTYILSPETCYSHKWIQIYRKEFFTGVQHHKFLCALWTFWKEWNQFLEPTWHSITGKCLCQPVRGFSTIFQNMTAGNHQILNPELSHNHIMFICVEHWTPPGTLSPSLTKSETLHFQRVDLQFQIQGTW